MIAASSLMVADEATPKLAADAVRAALAKAGRSQAQEVILFLSPEFARLVPATLSAVTRTAGCLQIFGSIAAGVVTDDAWAIDRPAVAALVLCDLPAPTTSDEPPGTPVLSLCGQSHLPPEWLANPFWPDRQPPPNDHSPTLPEPPEHPEPPEPRFGLLYNDALSPRATPVWQGARLAAEAHVSLRFPGLDAALGLSTGLDTTGKQCLVEAANGHDLIRLDGITALESLRHALPPSLRHHRPLPVHCICSVARRDDETAAHLIPILSANADGTVTLAEPVGIGSSLSWALRLPANAEADMREMLDGLAPRCTAPSFGLFLSCIGRGPFFYAGEDRDWMLFRQRFPDLPFIGAYGTGQIFSADHRNRLLQNSVIAALFSA